MSFAECYLDETETDGARPVFAVAGCLLRKEAALRHADRWADMLQKWHLPYFHMTDCALNMGIYAHLTRQECDLAAREAIGIIRDAVSAYLYATVEISKLAEEMKGLEFLGGPYEWCASSILPVVAGWCARNPDITSVHYFFEDGAKGQSNAKYRIAEMLETDDFRSQCRYSGMSFICKQASPWIQAADILAWHAGKDAKRAFAGEPIRKDFAALLEGIPACGGNWSAPMIRSVYEEAISAALALGLPLEQLGEIDRLNRRNPKPER